MDATVTDFLNEINQIAPKRETKQQPEVWQECYDELTGYSYYWNTHTDEVTWTPPKSFKPAENNPKRTNQPKPSYIAVEKKKPELFVPPSAPQYSSPSVNPEAKTKIYSIQDTVSKPEVKKSVAHVVKSRQNPIKRGPPGDHSESDDEKIELITEYGEGSESELEEADIHPEKPASPIKQNESQSDDDDDIDLLAKIQQRAQELKKLGGEVPPEVKNIIQKTHVKDKHEKSKVISGFSLVAGYNSASSESESEEEQLPPKPIFPVVPPPKPIPETSHSTLFPITQPIDVKDFIGPSPQPPETVKAPENSTSGDFDNKAFQRKRRIGVSLVNSGKRPKDDLEQEGNEYKGFGFKAETDQNNQSTENRMDRIGASSIYPGFQKGGVMFVKSNVLNPTLTNEEIKVPSAVDEDSSIDRQETDDIYTVLRQKLVFLGEGRAPVLPVQVMLIQAETLFLAMKENGLKMSYLHKWLQETSSELIKLEKEAAPEGWLLQWDRSHNRYFYQNQATGESQWEYPQPDVSRCDEAMDISTTPPPIELPEPPREPKSVSPVIFGPQLPVEPPLPPSPPKIRDPTPPPPPMISLEQRTVFSEVPLPPEPLPVVPLPPLPPTHKKTFENGEPFPPGVDLPEVVSYNPPKEPEIKSSDILSSALDSFYSEIAEATENTNSNSPSSSSQFSEVPLEVPEDTYVQMSVSESVKKKKKKVKLAQGLTMKKKGVSQLVEKWKNVQKSYGD